MLDINDNLEIFWRFAGERQKIFWSQYYNIDHKINDPILKKYKFTNCYRVQDRTTQFLIRDVIYSKSYSPEDTFFRIILFKLFNKIETWLSIEKKITEISLDTFNIKQYDEILTEARAKEKIYSGAYIMPSGVTSFGSSIKHQNHLMLVDWMVKNDIHKRVWNIKTLKEMYLFFLEMPTIGNFLAFQFSIDMCYSPYTDIDESEYIVAGPGALRGLKKCFNNFNTKKASHYIKWVYENQDSQFKKYNIDFKYLGDRRLQLIDCQNLFCEIDKYLRVYKPYLDSTPKRIKQIYKRHGKKIDYFFPPKWKVEI